MSGHSSPRWLPWAFAGVLVAGTVLTSTVLSQRVQSLRMPLETAVPMDVESLVGTDATLSDEEIEVAGMTDYVMRVYEPAAGGEGVPAPWLSIYVGFYETQTQGRTIHSPKNCMPGSGWQALDSRRVVIPAGDGSSAEVNRYVLMNEDQQVLVLYWYQGRGRVVASEYQAKWELLRDAALKRRSDEALVRIVVPVIDGRQEDAFTVASGIARTLLPAVTESLPAA